MKTSILGPYILGSAVIWGATIVGASLLMGGVEASARILSLLGGGAAVHLILVWVPLAAALKKTRDSGGTA